MDEFADRLSRDPGSTGIFSDFDGTLARIVDDPADARPVEGVVEVLGALVPRFVRVGVISGRPASFLLDRLVVSGLFLSGLYGMERVEDGAVVPTDEAAPWRPVVEGAVEEARRDLRSGMHVEDKGLSLTIHYRGAPDAAASAREYADRVAEETGLVVHPARLSVELAPPVVSSKGSVLADAARGLGAACFIGDDAGDLTAFDTLDQLADAGATTMRVGVDSEEAPAELLERADLVVPGPEAVVELLRSLTTQR